MTRETDPLLKNRQQPQPQPLVKPLFKKLLTIIIPLSLIIISSYYIMTHHHQNDPNNTDGPILTLRLYTNNIRFDNKNYPDKYEQPWEIRKFQSINSMQFNTFQGNGNIICLQEVLHNQLIDILKGLNDIQEWNYYGVGRTDGENLVNLLQFYIKIKILKLLKIQHFGLVLHLMCLVKDGMQH